MYISKHVMETNRKAQIRFSSDLIGFTGVIDVKGVVELRHAGRGAGWGSRGNGDTARPRRIPVDAATAAPHFKFAERLCH